MRWYSVSTNENHKLLPQANMSVSHLILQFWWVISAIKCLLSYKLCAVAHCTVGGILFLKLTHYQRVKLFQSNQLYIFPFKTLNSAPQFTHSFLMAEAEQAEHQFCFKRCSDKATIVTAYAGLFAPFGAGLAVFKSFIRWIRLHFAGNTCLVNFRVRYWFTLWIYSQFHNSRGRAGRASRLL